jgi:anti-sigma B factor antagonist
MADVDVSSSRCAGHVVVALRGELDVVDAARLPHILSAAAAPGSRVIVDLAGLTFIDCSSLSALVSARKQALKAGGDLLLAAPRGTALYLLSLVDPAGLLPVLASVAQAADGARRPTASDRLAFARVDGEALLGNGEVARARDDTSAAGSL